MVTMFFTFYLQYTPHTTSTCSNCSPLVSQQKPVSPRVTPVCDHVSVAPMHRDVWICDGGGNVFPCRFDAVWVLTPLIEAHALKLNRAELRTDPLEVEEEIQIERHPHYTPTEATKPTTVFSLRF